jgi:hypothetical protein
MRRVAYVMLLLGLSGCTQSLFPDKFDEYHLQLSSDICNSALPPSGCSVRDNTH